MEYEAFIEGKARMADPVGFEPDTSRYAPETKDFQGAITTWACRRGRGALFEGTGLGKGLQELLWAQEVHHETGLPVLIETPLAVAEEIIAQAEKFNIDGVAYAADQDEAKTPIVVSNYDRLHLFDPSKFGGAALDESSIIKSEDGATRGALMEFCADIPYLLPATATPAPNDWTEFGQHAELLGVMRAKEMLAMYFVHDGSSRAGGGEGWRLKRHAETDFWRWVASWAVMIQSPADLGFDDTGYVLPPLRKHQVTVASSATPQWGEMFVSPVSTLQERIAERRLSLTARVGAAADIAKAGRDRCWVHWCQLNDEAEAMTRAIPGAVNLSGSDTRQEKIDKILAFKRGEIQDLVTKAKLAAFGQNWQHCHSTICVGMNDSFEQLYQLLRRFWRYGQTRPVDAYFVASDREGPVVANLDRKERDYDTASAAMVLAMRDFNHAAIRGGRVSVSNQQATRTMELPSWMAA